MTWESAWFNMLTNKGIHGSKYVKFGGGFLLRQRFESVHIIFCCAVTSNDFSNKLFKIGTIPFDNTKSLSLGPSPAIFPKAHTACSITRISGDLSKLISKGTAPIFTIAPVFSDDPDAILVNIHAHSY